MILADEDNEEEEVFDEEALLMASMGLPLAFASTSDYRRTVSGKFFWGGSNIHLCLNIHLCPFKSNVSFFGLLTVKTRKEGVFYIYVNG